MSSRPSALRPTAPHETDRDTARRSEPGLLERLAADPATRLLLADARGRVALAAPAIRPDLPLDGLTPFEPAPGNLRLADLRATDADLSGLLLIYLGRSPHGGAASEGRTGGPGQDAEGASWIAAVIPDGAPATTATDPQEAEGTRRPRADLERILAANPLSALRAVGAALDTHDAGLATAAVALSAWHASAPHCAACGARTEPCEAGWARRCPRPGGCGATSFPRTDPAVIMAVTDERDRIVLVHGAAWPPLRYSTVAGFVEAGESAEAAVAREVAEEIGLRVEAVEHVATQPWPFPRSLMLGYRARLAPGEGPARPDDEEVTDAVTLSRAELAQAVAAGKVILPGPTSIARLLIEDWYGGELPETPARNAEGRPEAVVPQRP
ncbi:NAD(+) diphosphatase [Actinomyces gaoshouyii]|uniref:NAD(+) diphosphatase n=1 Tax=Actinomyces gaoshouyii TaxID=1960083 RepID=A0A8H9H9F3_9ACTO|nr:NAD(+) diphosphatase [Actinomyces gaoshouyii]GGO97009.1 hypothetical protein GCM10011612_08580 [Actinomyces gaoshouyii]